MPAAPPRAARTKLTLRLPKELVQTAEEAVSLGLAANTTAFIEEAMRTRIREVRHARLRLLAAEAVADPGFVADMRETAEAFSPVLTDQWPLEEQDGPQR